MWKLDNLLPSGLDATEVGCRAASGTWGIAVVPGRIVDLVEGVLLGGHGEWVSLAGLAALATAAEYGRGRRTGALAVDQGLRRSAGLAFLSDEAERHFSARGWDLARRLRLELDENWDVTYSGGSPFREVEIPNPPMPS